MALRMIATDVHEISEGVWRFEMPPHQVRHFGSNPNSIGTRSVMLFKSYEFNRQAGELHFYADEVSAINVGTEPIVIGLAAKSKETTETAEILTSPLENRRLLGPGDNEYIRMAKEVMSPPMQKTAIALLNGVRSKSSGDMKKGQSRNFSNTPDNFWYVIFQPRKKELSVTVRGSVDHFKPVAKLPIKDDRGNTRFKVTCEEDVPAALQMIFHAKRKKL